jgi:hypothetical protein
MLSIILTNKKAGCAHAAALQDRSVTGTVQGLNTMYCESVLTLAASVTGCDRPGCHSK